MQRSDTLIHLILASTLILSCSATWASDSTADLLPRQKDRPLENIDGVDSYYGSVEVEPGVRLRTLISKPKGIKEPLHPILFTQWVSCGSIELKEGDGGKLGMIMRESGLALIRVDRAGAGDSQGPSCDKLDYDTELAHYVSAFENLLNDKRIDSSKVYLMGESLGSTTAPLIANSLQEKGYNVDAVIVQGGGALTHLERMIHFDRIYLERRPDEVTPSQIHSQMTQRIIFHTEYLAKGRHPDEVAKDSANMLAVRNDVRGLDKDNHYGRPFEWHQQAAKQNFLAAWESLNSKVLVIYNEFDQFETRHGHKLIIDTVNRRLPNSGTFMVQKGLGHSSWQYKNTEAAYAYQDGSSAVNDTAKIIVAWLKSIDKKTKLDLTH